MTIKEKCESLVEIWMYMLISLQNHIIEIFY